MTANNQRYRDMLKPHFKPLKQLALAFLVFMSILWDPYHHPTVTTTSSPATTAESCASALLSGWIARFGVPVTITSDQGQQFESHLWKALMNLLGTKHNRTTAYHPQANGLVERFHRHLKSSLKARLTNGNWIEELPILLLGIQTTLKEDLSCTAAEMV